jgi:CheY-like chemotaxis protein
MIFILDDDPSIRKALTRLLRSVGYDSLAFAEAGECLVAINAAGASADCVIIDLHMPGMGGLQLQCMVNRRDPPLPVIVLTGAQDVDLPARAVEAGAVRVLRKPCDAQILLEAIAEATGGPPTATATATAMTTTTRKRTASDDDPDHFLVEDGHARYRPVASVSFDRAAAMVRVAIAAARRHRVSDLLVDTTGLTGFASPETFERFLAVVGWATEARGSVRLAMVARAELIDPQKLGVRVAADRDLVSDIFTTEAEARAWLAAAAEQ